MEVANKKAVAYVRISSQRQINNESPVTQKDVIQKYADSNNIEIVQWFEDIAKSGKNADRDGLLKMLQYCLKHRGEIDHWIVYNMKRASRDIDSYTTEVKVVLKKLNISIRSATEPGVTDTKEGRFLEGLFVLVGQLDNEGKAETTIDNMRALALQGYWQHPPIVGYDPCKIPNDLGKLRPSLKPSDMAEKVRKVLERYSKGDISKAELTRYAAEAGLRSRYGKKLSKDRIHKLLTNPTYAGFVNDRFTENKNVEGKHVGIISVDTFEANQELLYGKNSRKGETHLKLTNKYPLKGLLRCHNCDKNLYASAPTMGSGSPSPRYHCSRPSCRGLVKSVKAKQVHADFIDMLQQIKPTDGVLRLYKTILVREAGKSLGNLNKQVTSLRDELSDLDTKRLKVIEKVAEGVLTVDEKSQLTDAIDSQKLEKAIQLETLEKQQQIREGDIDQAIQVMDEVSEQWSVSELDVKVRFQSMLFPKGLVYDSNSGRFGTSEISPLYRYAPTKKDLPEPEKSFLVAQVHSNWNLILEELNRWLTLNRGRTGLISSTAAH